MPQSKIQDWIKRIRRHVDEVILLEGGNKYKEGRCHGQLKTRVYYNKICFVNHVNIVWS